MSLNYSANFTGANYLNITNYTGNPAAFSVACFLKLTVGQVVRTFWSNFQSSGSKGWVFGIDDSTTNKLKFYIGGSNLISATALTTGAWTQVVATYDGTTAKIYLNGSSTPDATLTAAVSYGTVPTNNYIGAEPSVSQFVNGRMAGVGYWSKALSTTEIASLYNGGAGLAGSELSGTLLTSLGSYYDFINSASLGTDSSGNGHTYTNTGTVVQGFGPSPPAFGYTGPAQPASLVLNPAWSSNLVRAQIFPAASGTSFPDLASLATYSVVSGGAVAWTTNAFGNALNPNDSTGQGGPNLLTPIASGATQFTMSALASTNTVTGGGAGLRHLWGAEGGSNDMRLCLFGGVLVFQIGADGAFPQLSVDPPPLNTLIVITCRLTAAGVLSIWYGPIKVAERTDTSPAWGANGAGLVLGSSGNITRNWSGQINGGYVESVAWTDAQIVALSADFFAPARAPDSIHAALLPAM